MTNLTDKPNNRIITILNGALTELTKDEIALLLDYRLADEEGKEKIEELIKNLNK